MQSKNIPDDELDNFFRKSLQQPEIDFKEESWLKLDKKLDAFKRGRVVKQRFIISILTLLLFLTPFLSWYISYIQLSEPIKITTKGQIKGKPNKNISSQTPFASPNAKPSKKESVISTFPVKPPFNGSTSDNTTEDLSASSHESDLANSVPTKKMKPKFSLNTTADKKKVESRRLITDRKQVNTFKAHKKITRQANTKKTDTNKIKIIPSPILIISNSENENLKYGLENIQKSNIPETITQEDSANKTLPTISKKVDSKASDKDNDSIALPSVWKENSEFPFHKGIISFLPVFSIRLLSHDLLLAKKYDHNLQRISYATAIAHYLKEDSIFKKLASERIRSWVSMNVLLSPDLSSVWFSHLVTPGTNMGVTLEYHFSSKLSVLTGVAYSSKIYAAAAKSYKPTPGFWTYKIWPVEVKGRCNIIDIPINIRYNFLLKDKYNLSVSTGFSSYLMLKENYKYIYNVDDSHLIKSWRTSNENKHLFKIFNISAGYERWLNNSFSLKAEPFIKLPMAGIGFGKIKLLSTGIFVSLKYKF